MNLTTALNALHLVGAAAARAPEFVALFNQAITALHPTDQATAKAALHDLQTGNDAGHQALQAKLAKLAGQ
ncbi:hypothetical protein ABTN09_21280 [Acinetobacter baumannii]